MEQQSSRGRGLFIRWTFILGLGMLGALAAGPARAWDPTAPAPPEDFSAFNRRFSSDLYPYPRHGAAPLGLLGFEVYADATYECPGRKWQDHSSSGVTNRLRTMWSESSSAKGRGIWCVTLGSNWCNAASATNLQMFDSC